MAQVPTLKGSEVTFRTLDDDKDQYTHVTVVVRNSESKIVARVDGDFGHFATKSNNGPFDLALINEVPKSTLDGGKGYVDLSIDANGYDTWRFDISLTLLFTDGSKISATRNGVELSYEKPQTDRIPIGD